MENLERKRAQKAVRCDQKQHRRDKRCAEIADGLGLVAIVTGYVLTWFKIDGVESNVKEVGQHLASLENMTSGMFEKLSEDAMKQLVKKMYINTSRKFGMVKR
uniref:Uncharacterized protein n=1 Tax=Caenorhabditis japonica TaxID=281687 RepID=A0A8R1EN09_CAEJA